MASLGHDVEIQRVAGDMLALHQVFGKGHYDIRNAGAPDPTLIFDCGAHVGLATLYFASRYPHAHIVAVEPHPRNFKILRNNTDHLTNVTCVQAAVWHRRTRLRIRNPWAQPWGFRVTEAREGSVRAVTLDDLADEYGRGSGVVLKLDVEGAEVGLVEHLGSSLLSLAEITFIEFHGVSGRAAGQVLDAVECLARGTVGDTRYYIRETTVS